MTMMTRDEDARRFMPAFFDIRTNVVYLSRYADGRPAPFHLPDGLPRQLAPARNTSGSVTGGRAMLVAGFVYDGLFYTREEAARELNHLKATVPDSRKSPTARLACAILRSPRNRDAYQESQNSSRF